MTYYQIISGGIERMNEFLLGMGVGGLIVGILNILLRRR